MWLPTERELSEVGLVQAAAAPPSSLQETPLAFVVVQANVAEVDVVDAGGVVLKLIVGGAAGAGAGAGALIVHVNDALGSDHFCCDEIANECVPGERSLYVVGLVQASGEPESSRHQRFPFTLVAVHVNVADVEVVDDGGVEVIVTLAGSRAARASAGTSVRTTRVPSMSRRARYAEGR
ncbi:MAG TPA: hypothetical protein VFB26_02780 [Gaiellaceae bacterium]|nr:hypothetical protein [Gaiellaceae bacterium]